MSPRILSGAMKKSETKSARITRWLSLLVLALLSLITFTENTIYARATAATVPPESECRPGRSNGTRPRRHC